MLVVLIALSAPALAQEPPKEPAKPAAEKVVLEIEKSAKPPDCVIKPVMSDEELRACGARIPQPQ